MNVLHGTILLLAALGSIASASPAGAESPTVGEIVPDFTLTDQRGERTHLAAEASEKTTVLVFYRGYW